MSETAGLYAAGSPEYESATRPANTVAQQHPAFVARPTSADAVAAVVRKAAQWGLRVVPQATGHGAGARIGADVLLMDTSGLDAISIDARARTARTGAGSTWGRVNAAAWPHSLLGLAGSASGVSVAGYTFGGGLGWLAKAGGMASGALRRVEYITGRGEIRVAADDASDRLDRDAMWAFRGGGGVGLATELEFELVPVPELWAGYLLWEVDALDAVVTAWREGVQAPGGAAASSLSVLHLPPAPTFPEPLRGRTVVHLALASADGPDSAAALLDAVRRAAAPAVDTWGPSDAGRLAGIHLDPPGAVPALGTGRWLDGDAPAVAASALRVALEQDTPLVLVELRDVGTVGASVDGALTRAPSPFLLHAVGPVRSSAQVAIEAAFVRLHDVVAAADVGRIAAPWMDGAASTTAALPNEDRERVEAIADAVDPDGVLFRSRYLAQP